MVQCLPFSAHQRAAPRGGSSSGGACRGLFVKLRSIATAAIVVVTGCSTWSAATVTELPLPRSSPDSVVFEAAFVRVPPEQQLDELWRQTDEQHLDADARRTLIANGIRCGVLGSQLPTELQELMGSSGTDPPVAASESLISDSVTTLYRKLQNRTGERSELIVVPAISERKVVLFHEEGRIRAETFEEGQALFAIRGYPSGDGTVRVELVPEIRHGDVTHQWVPGNGTFLHDVGRKVRAFDQLRLTAVVSPGQTLVVTGTEEAKGLGGLLFARGSGDSSERLLLLLRLAQTQYDDLFAPEQTVEPLVTPID